MSDRKKKKRKSKDGKTKSRNKSSRKKRSKNRSQDSSGSDSEVETFQFDNVSSDEEEDSDSSTSDESSDLSTTDFDNNSSSEDQDEESEDDSEDESDVEKEEFDPNVSSDEENEEGQRFDEHGFPVAKEDKVKPAQNRDLDEHGFPIIGKNEKTKQKKVIDDGFPANLDNDGFPDVEGKKAEPEPLPFNNLDEHGFPNEINVPNNPAPQPQIKQPQPIIQPALKYQTPKPAPKPKPPPEKKPMNNEARIKKNLEDPNAFPDAAEDPYILVRNSPQLVKNLSNGTMVMPELRLCPYCESICKPNPGCLNSVCSGCKKIFCHGCLMTENAQGTYVYKCGGSLNVCTYNDPNGGYRAPNGQAHIHTFPIQTKGNRNRWIGGRR